MRRNSIVFVFSVIALSQAACGDPIVILGESPGIIRNVAGIGDSSGNTISATATKSKFRSLSSVAFNDETNILSFADRGANKVQNGITTPIARLFSTTSAGSLTMMMDGGGCNAAGACLIEATHMIAAPAGSLLITDAIGNRVFQFNTATRTLSIIAGTGATLPAVDGAQASLSSIQGPTGIARDTDGTLYIAEGGSGRILKIGTDGIIHVIAGGGTAAITGTAAGATTVRMGGPSGLALGSGGILYIADRELNGIYALTLASAEIKRIVGDGLPGFTGDGGPASEARVQSPRDLELSADGITLYIADTGNNRVRSMNLTTGILHTYAGSGLTAYNGDYVPAGAANLNLPVELAVSRLGFLFVVDQAHHVVRRATNTF